MSDRRRVAVTGLGMVAPVGLDVKTCWDNVLAGRSGIGPITGFDVSGFSVRFGGEVNGLDIAKFIAPKEARKMDPFVHYGIVAAAEAIADAGIDASQIDADRVGVAIGSGIGGLPGIERGHLAYLDGGPRKISPFFVPANIINMISGNVSIRHGFRGPNVAMATACASATHSIGSAARMIEYGDADVMVAGGAEMAICPMGLGGFAAARALSTRNDAPEQASRPWDRERDGFVLSDGAGVIVLEEEAHARRRGARIHAWLDAFGMSGDAHHMTQPDASGDGAKRCMQSALQNGRVDPDRVDYINAHGTSTPAGDLAETRAIKSAFGKDVGRLLVSSTKSMTGHLLGAAGGVEAIFTVLALRDQVIPPTINLDHPDEECDLDYVPHTAREARVDVALSNSFGFGGTNASLLFSRAN